MSFSPAIAARAGLPETWVNDVHAQLSPTRVHQVLTPSSEEEVVTAVRSAADSGLAVSVCGGRHAMGGQPFGTGAVLLDLRGLAAIRALDTDAGLVEVDAGIQWPALVSGLEHAQQGRSIQWGIVQKQTGADRLTLGGALASNIHGRGLALGPFVGEVEGFTLVDAEGRPRRISRQRDKALFRLAVGGYGLFGVVTAVTLRLTPRRKVERIVEVHTADALVERVERRVAHGYLFGDFQFAVDPRSDDFLRRGVFSCYRPVAADTVVPAGQKELRQSDWCHLLGLAHTDPSRAFQEYSDYYLSTSGQVYWSDTHQLSDYVDDYHAGIDASAAGGQRGTEMITEVYVPRHRLADFLDGARRRFRDGRVRIVYGTIRFIERDDETFLPWARERYACVVFNLHVPHTDEGRERSATAFRDLIDLALDRGGSYYLTYHRFARRDQVLAAYPQMPDFLQWKRAYDPDERFQSDWYRHYRGMFA